MRTTKRERNTFAKAVRQNDAATVKMYMARYPDIVLSCTHVLCSVSNTAMVDTVVRGVPSAGRKIIHRFALDALVNYRADIFAKLFANVNDNLKRELVDKTCDLNVYRCLLAAIQLNYIEMFRAYLPRALSIAGRIPIIHDLCMHGTRDMIVDAVNQNGFTLDGAMFYLTASYNPNPSPLAVTAKIVETTTVLIELGCECYEMWFAFVSRIDESLQTLPLVVQTAFNILERTSHVNDFKINARLARELLVAGLPRERLSATRFGIPPSVLIEFDAVRDTTRVWCTRHMPRVLGDIVASYLP